jgi:hypothetical protein
MDTRVSLWSPGPGEETQRSVRIPEGLEIVCQQPANERRSYEREASSGYGPGVTLKLSDAVPCDEYASPKTGFETDPQLVESESAKSGWKS